MCHHSGIINKVDARSCKAMLWSEWFDDENDRLGRVQAMASRTWKNKITGYIWEWKSTWANQEFELKIRNFFYFCSKIINSSVRVSSQKPIVNIFCLWAEQQRALILSCSQSANNLLFFGALKSFLSKFCQIRLLSWNGHLCYFSLR